MMDRREYQEERAEARYDEERFYRWWVKKEEHMRASERKLWAVIVLLACWAAVATVGCFALAHIKNKLQAQLVSITLERDLAQGAYHAFMTSYPSVKTIGGIP